MTLVENLIVGFVIGGAIMLVYTLINSFRNKVKNNKLQKEALDTLPKDGKNERKGK